MPSSAWKKKKIPNPCEQQHNQLKGRIEELNQNIGTILGNVNTLSKSTIPQLKNQLADLKRIESEFFAKQNEISRNLKKQDTASELSKIVNLYLSTLRTRITEIISQKTTHLFNSFYPNLGFEKLAIDKNYNIQVVRYGKEYDSARLSGGEKAAAGLAIRIAMAQQLVRQGIFILDEPTESLDEQHKEILVDFIKSKIPIRQVIIISHYDKMREGADNIITVGYGDGEKRKIHQNLQYYNWV